LGDGTNGEEPKKGGERFGLIPKWSLWMKKNGEEKRKRSSQQGVVTKKVDQLRREPRTYLSLEGMNKPV